MRLSALHALLDESKAIQPEHHHAAMALWEYSERSAGWIFGTYTGDKNADKILSALRSSGPGLTKTEISEQVFNRHLNSGTLTDALRILRESGYANFRQETTGGAPSERWFVAGAKRELSEVRGNNGA